MKKLFLTAALASAVAFANAQTMTSKNGTPILPESGDWSVGFDAVPVINYFGNLFNNTSSNTVSLNAFDNQVITGKYMKDASTAYRVKLGINFGSTTLKNNVSQDGATTAGATVTDEWKNSNSGITLGAGIQKFRGKGRLQGIYGAEAMIHFGSTTDTYTYGNAYSTTNQTPTSTTDFTSGASSQAQFGRPTEVKHGSNFKFGINAFVGAEYFFAPKMSLGGEFGWGIKLSSTGEGTDNTTFGSINSKSSTGKASSFGIDTDPVGSGTISMNLYF